MFGIFYPEDIENIKFIDKLVEARKQAEAAKQKQESERNKNQRR